MVKADYVAKIRNRRKIQKMRRGMVNGRVEENSPNHTQDHVLMVSLVLILLSLNLNELKPMAKTLRLQMDNEKSRKEAVAAARWREQRLRTKTDRYSLEARIT